MADHIDYAAHYLEQHIGWPADKPIDPANFPWIGLAVALFQHLDHRGFKVVRE